MKNIKFKKDFVERRGINEIIYDSINLETDFVKQYKNSISSLFKLTPLATKYILFATENMSIDNIYRHDIYNKEMFVKHLEKVEETCNIGSLDKIAVELTQKGFFTPINRGVYEINPQLFWKDNEDNRIEKIKLSLEFNYNEKVKIEINKK